MLFSICRVVEIIVLCPFWLKINVNSTPFNYYHIESFLLRHLSVFMRKRIVKNLILFQLLSKLCLNFLFIYDKLYFFSNKHFTITFFELCAHKYMLEIILKQFGQILNI